VPVKFEMEHSRYLCKACNITFMDQIDYLPEQRGITVDAENYIISKLGTQTFTEISADLGVSVQTVANRAKDFGKAERERQLKGRYRYLSMDEVFITRNSEGEAVYYWLLNDNSRWKSNKIRIDVGRKKEDVIQRLLELSHPESVAAVSIDMWTPYRDAISEALPQVDIVVDPFHVIQHAQKAMETVRKKAIATSDLKAGMKKDSGLFLTSMFKLSDDELDLLESYLKADSDIKNAYFIVQELSGLYRLRDYEQALDYLANWETEVLKSGIKEMIDVLRTVQNWLPYIMNYFIHRITNGKTEGKNHLLRVIDKMGFHYGIDSIQACIYAHDRKQEYVKWQRRLRKRSKDSASAA
jgi:transposase